MALPIIAAGVAARYGAKKLAKYLVKRNTKKVLTNMGPSKTQLKKQSARLIKKQTPSQKSLFKKGELKVPFNPPKSNLQIYKDMLNKKASFKTKHIEKKLNKLENRKIRKRAKKDYIREQEWNRQQQDLSNTSTDARGYPY